MKNNPKIRAAFNSANLSRHILGALPFVAVLLGRTAVTPVMAQDLATTASSPSSVMVGDNIPYSLSVVASGSAASGVTLSAPLPTNTTFVSARQINGAGFTVTSPAVGSSGTVQFSTPTLGVASTVLAPSNLVDLNGTLLFAAADTTVGGEPWKSDGTATGTGLVKDIRAGTVSSLSPTTADFTVANNTLFFVANDGPKGAELWKSDGSATGTVNVKDIITGAGSSAPTNLTNVNGTLFFSANSATGFELWKSDGSATGTVQVQDINPGSAASSPNNLVNVNGTLFFAANDGTTGNELWKSDGTAAGTVLVKDIYPGSTGSIPTGQTNFTNVNGTLFFWANDGTNGTELWKSDGTSDGTQLVKDINPGSAGLNPSVKNLVNVGGTLFFTPTDTSSHNHELWKSDGTADGTILIKDIFPGGNSNISNLLNVNGTLFFTATDGVSGQELWKSDGTASGTVLVKDIVVGSAGAGIANLTNLNGVLLFTASTGSNNDLWKSDGTANGTVLVKNFYPVGFPTVANFTVSNGSVFFSASGGTGGQGLWKSDGTTDGTVLVSAINGPSTFEIVVKTTALSNSTSARLNSTATTTSTDPVPLNNYAVTETYVDSSQAGTSLQVTNLNDTGTGSLRAAITTANATAGDDTITFAPGLTGTITLGGTNLLITSNLTIQGPTDVPITINANLKSRCLLVNGGRVTISNLNLTGGKIGGGGYISGTGDGAGIRQNDGILTLDRCTLYGNTVTNGYGGGMIRYGGDTILTNCTIAGNVANGATGTAGRGGGLDFEFGSGTISNCTIANNSVGESGGGLYTNTITGYDNGLVTTIDNSIIASNPGGDTWGTATSLGYNLIGTVPSQSFGVSTDQFGTINGALNPNFVTDSSNHPLLAFNGGSTLTVALQSRGLAVDRGKSSLLIDERGFTRPFDIRAVSNAVNGNVTNGSDIGAFEVQNSPPTGTLSIQPASPRTNDSIFSSVTASDPDGDRIVSYAYSWTKNGTVIPGENKATIDLSKAGNGSKGDKIGATVVITDVNGGSGTATASEVTIVNSAPNFVTTTLVDATVNFSYGPVQLQANDADGDALSWSVTAGDLPTGLSLSSDGILSGTATALGASDFTVSVSDGDAPAVSKALTLNVVPPPTVSVSDASAYEGNTGSNPAGFVVTLSGSSAQPITLDYSTSNGSATAGSDFTSASGTLIIPAGQTKATIPLSILGDFIFEPDETFNLTLSSANGALFNGGVTTLRAIGTIQNDDNPPVLTLTGVSKAEGQSGTTPFDFKLSLSSVSATPITVNYATGNGTAIVGSDYTDTSGTLTIPAGASTATVTVNVNGDTAVESDETFTFALANMTGGATFPNNATSVSVLGTIINDDADTTPTATDVSGQLQVFKSGLSRNKKTGRWLMSLVIQNNGAILNGPLSLAFDGLLPGVDVYNADGYTSRTAPIGSPFRTLSMPGGALASGTSINLSVEFVNPNNDGLDFTPRFLQGPGAP